MKYSIKRNYEPLRMIALAQSEPEWKCITTIPYPSYQTINWNNFHKSSGWTISLRRHTLWSNPWLRVWTTFQGFLPFEPPILNCFRDVTVAVFSALTAESLPRSCEIIFPWFCLINTTFFKGFKDGNLMMCMYFIYVEVIFWRNILFIYKYIIRGGLIEVHTQLSKV